MNRSELREEAFKLLYSKEVQVDLEKDQIDEYITENNIDNPDYIYDRHDRLQIFQQMLQTEVRHDTN